ncbi:MAG: alpha/beta fold hydrolase [Dehalococcoidales bacterium]|nr:alpha/beta fold hydrolase [Dehalococcoidales bacterium]
MIEQEVEFQSKGFKISGTITIPSLEGNFPGVLLIPGSGQIDRNENHKKLHINVLHDIAAYLDKHNIAALRYDKRGVGASEGNYWKTGLYDNVSVALSAFKYLKDQQMIRSDKVFLLGHSEGALIATRLAADGIDNAGTILLAGAAQRGEDILVEQAEQVANSLKGFQKWLLRLLRIDIIKAQQKQFNKIKHSSKDWYRVQLITKMNAKWMREFMAYNPADDFPKIRVPVLAITGSKDIQANPKDLLQMAKLVTTDFEYHEIPNVTHILRIEEGKATLSTYKKQVQQPMDARIMPLILNWLQKQIGN